MSLPSAGQMSWWALSERASVYGPPVRLCPHSQKDDRANGEDDAVAVTGSLGCGSGAPGGRMVMPH